MKFKRYLLCVIPACVGLFAACNGSEKLTNDSGDIIVKDSVNVLCD